MAMETLDSLDVLSSPQGGSANVAPTLNSRKKYTGWLLKRKSEGVASRLFRSFNRRYFTLDFEGQLFYYAHNEANKTASMPLAFRNLLSVEPFEATLQDAHLEEQEPSAPSAAGQQSRGGAGGHHAFRVPKISFGALKRPAHAEHHGARVEPHGFVLRLVGREMELLGSSKEDTEAWMAAFREAIALGVEGGRPSTCAEGSEHKVEASTSAGSSPKAPLSPRSEADSLQEVQVPQDSPEAHQAAAEAQQAAQQQHRLGSPRGTHQAFAAAPDEEKEAPAAAAAKPSRRGFGGLLPRRLGGRPRAAEVKATEGAVTSLDFEAALLQEAGDQAWGEEKSGVGTAAASKTASEAAKRYDDKGQGLSLQERLAQMDFSDDEDE